MFDRLVSVTWRNTSKPLTEPARLVERGKSYGLNQNVIFAITELPGGNTVMFQSLLLGQPGGDEETLPPSVCFVNTFGRDEEVGPQRLTDDFNV